MKFHCIYKSLPLIICILWYSTLKIWCTCLLEYFDLVKQRVSFKTRDNFLIKNDGNSCNSLCIFLCFLLHLLSFLNQTVLLVIMMIHSSLSPCLLTTSSLSCYFV